MRFLNRSRFLSGIITFIFAGLFLNSGMISANAANDISVTMPTGDFYSETGSETVEEIKLSEEEYNELVGSNFRRARVRNASSGTSYYYNQLSSNDKLFYDALLSMARADKDAVSGFSFNGISSGNISLVYEGTKYLNDVDISSVRNALNFDHPEELEGMLHLPAHVVISSSSGGTVRYAYYCFFRRGSDYTGSQIAAMEDELQNALSNTYSSIALSGSDVDKELAIHDALIKKIEYDHECADNNSVYDVAHTAYGALVDGSAVCDGYSKAFKMLLQKAGIESHVVAGFGNGGGHAWSVVKLDSDYYEVDVTWDDQEKYSSALYYNMLSHDYFNRTTEDFKSHQFNVPGFKTNTTTHVRNEKYLGYLEPPVANGTAKSYANVKKVYKVTFEGVIDGAKVSTTYSDTYTYEGKIVKMPTSVSLTGYTFGGWYTQKSGGTVIDKNTVLTGPTTAYAHWISKNVKVTFDANGGTSTPDPVTIAGGTAIGTLPTTSRTGYDFDGWYDAKTGGNKVTTTTKINSDMTLYAHWTAKTVTVTLNDGSSTADTITVKYNGKYEGLPTSRTKTGYTFGGWYLESSYKTLITASSVVGNANNHTLYAKWTAINYTVTFDANGGTPTPDPVSITYGTAIGTLPSVSMYGYDFAGWYDAKSGGNKVTSSTKIYSNMTLYAHWTAKTVTVTLNDGSSTSDTITVKYNGKYEGLPTSRTRTGYTFGGWYLESTYKTLITASSVVGNANNHTLYAKWTAINYTVSFDANGGTPTPDPVSVTYGTAIGTLPSVSMYGYDFDGWYDAKTSGNKVTSSTKIYSNMTLYAHWTAKSITVTLDDGSSTSDTITVKYNGKYEGLPTSRTRTGYIFGGWYLESSYKTLITANSVVGNANNHTLYAQWKIATVTVAFHAEGTDKPYEELSAHFGDSFASVMKERGVPTLDGYDFAGWFTASEGGDEVTKEDIISSTDIQNLYAQWTPLPDPVEEETPGENDPPGSGSETPGDESETPGSETPGSGSETPGDESETPGIETPGSGSETPGDEIETPGSGSETPGSGSETPGDEIETPDSGSETPGDEIETPGSGSETPGSGSETPGDEIETPGSGSETPGSGSETPGDENETPGSGSETPGDEIETPGNGSETPGDEIETPGSGSETPGDEIETPGSGSETPGSGSETPGDEIETPGSGSETPGDEIETPGSGSETPGDEIETPGSGSETPGDEIETPGSGSETPGDEIETPGSGRETPGDEIETPGSGSETPGSGSETPGDEIETPGSGSETPGSGSETPADEVETPGSGSETPADEVETPGNGSNPPIIGKVNPGSEDENQSGDSETPAVGIETPEVGNENPSNDDEDHATQNENADGSEVSTDANEDVDNASRNEVSENPEANAGTSGLTQTQSDQANIPSEQSIANDSDTANNKEASLPASGKINVGDKEYAVSSAGTVAVAACENKKVKSVSISGTVSYNGVTYKITEIKNGAYKNCKKLKNVTIGKNIKKIGAGTFKGCSKLGKIKIFGNSLSSVGAGSFKGIKKDATITIVCKNKRTYDKLVKMIIKAGAKTAKFKFKKS